MTLSGSISSKGAARLATIDARTARLAKTSLGWRGVGPSWFVICTAGRVPGMLTYLVRSPPDRQGVREIDTLSPRPLGRLSNNLRNLSGDAVDLSSGQGLWSEKIRLFTHDYTIVSTIVL